MLSKKDINNKYKMYFADDESIPFITSNKRQIFIKPFKMKDMNIFSNCVGILQFEEIEYARLRLNTYLDYLIYLVEHENEYKEDSDKYKVGLKLMTIFDKIGINVEKIRLCKNEKNKNIITINRKTGFKKSEKGNILVVSFVPENSPNKDIQISQDEINYYANNNKDWYGDKNFQCGDRVEFVVNKDDEEYVEINAKDIDLLRQLICYQNIYDYDDTYIDPIKKRDMEEYQKLQSKNNKIEYERQKMEVWHSLKCYKYEELNDFTIRRFYYYLSFIHDYDEWHRIRQGECTGMVTLKKPLTHYLCNSTPTEMTVEEFKNKTGL